MTIPLRLAATYSRQTRPLAACSNRRSGADAVCWQSYEYAHGDDLPGRGCAPPSLFAPAYRRGLSRRQVARSLSQSIPRAQIPLSSQCRRKLAMFSPINSSSPIRIISLMPTALRPSLRLPYLPLSLHSVSSCHATFDQKLTT